MKLLHMLLPLGRVDDSASHQLRWAWSGSGFALRFFGTRLSIRARGSRCWVRTLLDGVPGRVLELEPGTESVELCSGLPQAEHELRVQLRTEPLVGGLVVSGFDTDGHFLAPPSPRGPRIEFVGDSITCGYGNLALDETHPFDPATEDFFRSYAGLVATGLDADFHCVAWSGLGACRNFNLEPEPTLLERYGEADPSTGRRWDLDRWVPEVVVVNLGSNDHYRYPLPLAESFQGALERFVRMQLGRDGALKVVLVDGPLLKNGFPCDEAGEGLPTLDLVRGSLDAVAGRFPSDRVFRFSLTPAHPSRGYGADWHPSLAQHALNADELLGFLRGRVLSS